MKVFITGIAGVLGSNLANFLVSKGYKVIGNDIVRKEEAWRLECMDQIDYQWKSSNDLCRRDLVNVDILFDCGIGVADRPLGNTSPFYTVHNNIEPALRILEVAKRMKKKPILVYASSFNSLYGKINEVYSENTPVCPSSIYGWTKGAVENLYLTYYRAFKVPVIVVRVGSAYGPKMRSDELIGRLIIYALKNRKFYLRSPESKRLWTYSKDVLAFYEKLIERKEKCIGKTLISAGNKEDQIVTNIQIANLIKELTDSEMEVELGEYEPGEFIDGKPVSFSINADYSRKLLDWSPKYSLEEGLKETIEWFKENLWRYK
ncbi:MAG: hypothetical protein DRO40_06845 [Thermoprotei archaeon]|nr:MAG: hypothetical protein DRO40_06845 [Thermoprotei archaeon]